MLELALILMCGGLLLDGLSGSRHSHHHTDIESRPYPQQPTADPPTPVGGGRRDDTRRDQVKPYFYQGPRPGKPYGDAPWFMDQREWDDFNEF